MNWTVIGYQPIDEFNFEGLCGMCFLYLFLNSKGDHKNTFIWRDVSIPNREKYLAKFCLWYEPIGRYIYTLLKHNIWRGWV